MDLGRTALRLVAGPLFVGHGTQKLIGWFGGHGLDGTGAFFEGQLGLKPGKRHATAAGASETIGGALLTLGALTPVAAGLITGVMITAIRKVHAPKGPWVTEGGYEYNAVLIAVVAA
jgi:putative oxidoreductase